MMMEEEFMKEEIKLEESNKTDDEVAIVRSTNTPECENTEPTVKITSWKRYCRPEPIQTVQSLGYGIFSTVYAQYIYDRVCNLIPFQLITLNRKLSWPSDVSYLCSYPSNLRFRGSYILQMNSH